jgi:hypothetical protein
MSWLVLATEAAEEHKDHTAFYAIGIVLACWAVILGVLGITRPNFPSNKAGRQAVIAITALLVLGTTGSAVITA